MSKIAIIGDGGWGTALGLTLLANGHQPVIWGPFPDYIREVKASGENALYLPGVKLPTELAWTDDRAEAVAGADVVVLAVPSRFFRAVAESFSAIISPASLIVSVAKGLDMETGRRMTETAEQALKCGPVAALSGPSFAEEVARRIPTAVVIACRDGGRAAALQSIFMNNRFRVYTSDDVVGVELGGALKNIIAVAAGVNDGIGFGDNTRAALITRGLAEISRLGVALGARAGTFAGLSGMGDLILTCGSKQSRNHTVGERIGRGEKAKDILAGMKQVAEGVWNCGIARSLARRMNVEVPIADEVYAVIHEGKDPRQAMESLMLRSAKAEA